MSFFTTAGVKNSVVTETNTSVRHYIVVYIISPVSIILTTASQMVLKARTAVHTSQFNIKRTTPLPPPPPHPLQKKYEPVHNKTYNKTCVTSKDRDERQVWQGFFLIHLSIVQRLWKAYAICKDSYQKARMPLIFRCIHH